MILKVGKDALRVLGVDFGHTSVGDVTLSYNLETENVVTGENVKLGLSVIKKNPNNTPDLKDYEVLKLKDILSVIDRFIMCAISTGITISLEGLRAFVKDTMVQNNLEKQGYTVFLN